MPKITKRKHESLEDQKVRKLFEGKLAKGHTFSILVGMDENVGFKSGTYVYAQLQQTPQGLIIKPQGTSRPPSKMPSR